MTDLYETLGLERGAGEPEIRAAYRQRAKSAHPDGGGSAAEFEQLNRAKTVLLDPERRARYDSTGTIDDGANDVNAKAMSLMVGAIDEVLSEAQRVGADPLRMNILERAKKSLFRQIATGERHIAESQPTIKTLEQIVKRFTTKKGKPNRLAPVFEQRLRAAHEQVEKNREVLVALKTALDILDDHKFEFDAGREPQNPSAIGFWNDA